MASASSADHSPPPRKMARNFNILEDMSALAISSNSSNNSQNKHSYGSQTNDVLPKLQAVVPLVTSKRINKQAQSAHKNVRKDYPSPLVKILTSTKQFRIQDAQSLNHDHPSSEVNVMQPSSISEGSAVTVQPHGTVQLSELMNAAAPVSTVPATNTLKAMEAISEQEEISRLKEQLQLAKNEILRQNQELEQQRITQHTVDQVLDSASETSFPIVGRSVSLGPNRGSSAPTNPPPVLSSVPFERFQDGWGINPLAGAVNQQPVQASPWNIAVTQPWSTQDARVGGGINARIPAAPQPQRSTAFRLEAFENEQPHFGGMTNSSFEPGFGRSLIQMSRPPSSFGSFYNNMDRYSVGPSPEISPPITPAPAQNYAAVHQSHMPYQPRPIGTALCATALEFRASAMGADNYSQTNPWNTTTTSDSGSTYMPSVEPMNYRRLLDRNMSCDWKYIVDKIVCSNDQQASIFLQQKLKIATPDQKRELVDAIVSQAYPLMINRFGNFLVQRCLEHGTPEQVLAIANAIRGNTLSLSMDAFGCHVVQKAFDVVPEEFKAIMVHELLRRIPETVIHRYACHVWQKLFELRWSDSPPQIMKYVNEALRGMWHEVALGETGSLVVQNIFENCLEEDKRPCINEVLGSIDVIAHGQFGNWCIQHICEHGAPADKNRAIEHVLRFATEYSTDQFASKVVEKCLKVGGLDFLDRYLERVCEGRPDRPRMPLIDISGDQYGNYLVQYILVNASPHHKEIVANHVRKHMVSLRGSKFGSRVAVLCCNPASATRPGPAIGMPMNNRFGLGGAMGPYTRPPPGPFR